MFFLRCLQPWNHPSGLVAYGSLWISGVKTLHGLRLAKEHRTGWVKGVWIYSEYLVMGQLWPQIGQIKYLTSNVENPMINHTPKSPEIDINGCYKPSPSGRFPNGFPTLNRGLSYAKVCAHAKLHINSRVPSKPILYNFNGHFHGLPRIMTIILPA